MSTEPIHIIETTSSIKDSQIFKKHQQSNKTNVLLSPFEYIPYFSRLYDMIHIINPHVIQTQQTVDNATISQNQHMLISHKTFAQKRMGFESLDNLHFLLILKTNKKNTTKTKTQIKLENLIEQNKHLAVTIIHFTPMINLKVLLQTHKYLYLMNHNYMKLQSIQKDASNYKINQKKMNKLSKSQEMLKEIDEHKYLIKYLIKYDRQNINDLIDIAPNDIECNLLFSKIFNILYKQRLIEQSEIQNKLTNLIINYIYECITKPINSIQRNNAIMFMNSIIALSNDLNQFHNIFKPSLLNEIIKLQTETCKCLFNSNSNYSEYNVWETCVRTIALIGESYDIANIKPELLTLSYNIITNGKTDEIISDAAKIISSFCNDGIYIESLLNMFNKLFLHESPAIIEETIKSFLRLLENTPGSAEFMDTLICNNKIELKEEIKTNQRQIEGLIKNYFEKHCDKTVPFYLQQVVAPYFSPKYSINTKELSFNKIIKLLKILKKNYNIRTNYLVLGCLSEILIKSGFAHYGSQQYVVTLILTGLFQIINQYTVQKNIKECELFLPFVYDILCCSTAQQTMKITTNGSINNLLDFLISNNITIVIQRLEFESIMRKINTETINNEQFLVNFKSIWKIPQGN